MTAAVAICVVLLLAGGVLLALEEPGPNPGVVLLRRYGIGPVFGLIAAFGVLALVATGHSAGFVVGLVVLVWIGVVSLIGGWLTMGLIERGLRRMVLRSRWPSVARSCGLAVTKDRRSRSWPGGDTVTLGSERVEWLPQISWGRALPGHRGVVFRLRPARGGTLADVGEAAERLAAGLHVHRVEVERRRADLGRLIVVWSDPFDRVVRPPDREMVR